MSNEKEINKQLLQEVIDRLSPMYHSNEHFEKDLKNLVDSYTKDKPKTIRLYCETQSNYHC